MAYNEGDNIRRSAHRFHAQCWTDRRGYVELPKLERQVNAKDRIAVRVESVQGGERTFMSPCEKHGSRDEFKGARRDPRLINGNVPEQRMDIRCLKTRIQKIAYKNMKDAPPRQTHIPPPVTT